MKSATLSTKVQKCKQPAAGSEEENLKCSEISLLKKVQIGHCSVCVIFAILHSLRRIRKDFELGKMLQPQDEEK